MGKKNKTMNSENNTVENENTIAENENTAAKNENKPEKTSDATSAEIKKEREALKDELKRQEEEIKAQQLEMKNKNKEIRRKRKEEVRQKGVEFRNSVTETGVKFMDGAKEMSSDLRSLLSKDISAMKRIQKTRAAEILAIFAKHNFYAGGFTPVEMRTTLEDLGPTYVKIGQIMSSRVDMLPESYCKELEKLRQNVKPLDAEVVRAVIEQETGKKIEEIYSEFNDEPLGSASIGQAHLATLLDGTKVVTKVQRPLIADMMRRDFVLLKKLATGIAVVNEGDDDNTEQIDLLEVINELEKVEDEELDFRVEAQNTIFFRENCIEDETVVNCPTIYPELTSERMLTMSCVDGYSIAKKDRLIEEGYDPDEIGAAIINNFVHQVLDVGYFHGDPHQGNIMVSKGIPYWIDFGMIGHLTDANIKTIQNLILSLIEQDTEALVDAAMAMGAASPDTDRAKLTEDLDALINKYMSVTNLDDLDTAVLLTDLTDAMGKHKIKVPGEYTMLIRAIATIEGVIEQLCPQLNLFEMISNKLLERAKESFDVQQALLGVGKDAVSIGKKAARVPGLAADALNGIIKGRTKINLELTGYDELMDRVSDTSRNIILAVFACVVFFGSCILCMTDIQPRTSDGMPIVAVFGFIFSIALAIYTVRRMGPKK